MPIKKTSSIKIKKKENEFVKAFKSFFDDVDEYEQVVSDFLECNSMASYKKMIDKHSLSKINNIFKKVSPVFELTHAPNQFSFYVSLQRIVAEEDFI